jgi:hypothetical protein
MICQSAERELEKWTVVAMMAMMLLTAACGGQQKTKSFGGRLNSDDSLSIELGNSEMITYHSETLGFDIQYPSFLRHQYLEDDEMEVFMTDDVSMSYMVQDIEKGDDVFRTPGQQLMGMGAELVEATDDYSIHTGTEGELEYYAKVIDDSTRIVTVILRYKPDNVNAVEPLKELVHDFMP